MKDSTIRMNLVDINYAYKIRNSFLYLVET